MANRCSRDIIKLKVFKWGLMWYQNNFTRTSFRYVVTFTLRNELMKDCSFKIVSCDYLDTLYSLTLGRCYTFDPNSQMREKKVCSKSYVFVFAANSIAELVAKYIKESDQETNNNTRMYKYKGVYFPEAGVKEDTLRHMSTWEARSDDVFVVSYPKAGMYTVCLFSNLLFSYNFFLFLVSGNLLLLPHT